MKKLVAVLIVLNLLAWSFALIPRVESVGSLTIPNTISAQPAGNLAASLLDANLTTIKDYVNNREVTIGTFAARPAASVAGRYYLATDINLGTFYVDTGSAWTQVAAGVTATTTYTNELASLTLINSSATNMNIAPGAAASDDTTFTNRILMILASNLIKLPDTAWVVGTNQGCLDTGALAIGTVHFFLIQRTDTNVVDGLCSLSATAPTMPTGYTKKRRIGSIPRFVASGSTVNLIASFTQVNDEFLFNSPVQDVDAANPGTSAVTRTLTVPTGIRVRAMGNVVALNVTTNFYLYVSALDQQDMAPSTTLTPFANLFPGAGGGTGGATWYLVRTNPSGQIRTRQTTSGAGDIFRWATYGWIDTRDR